MQKLYKQFGESVTKWDFKNKFDEFFVARLRLTFYYTVTAFVILGVASVALYSAILSNFAQSILLRGLDSTISQAIIVDAQDILLDRFLTVDFIILFFIIILGFLLTEKTLKPIKSNMQKQKRFIADASHELRTPIAVVISGLEVSLSNKRLDFLLAKKTLESTLDEMREFSKLSNTLLDITKYNTLAHVKHESIDISELVKSVIERYKSLAALKGINIETKLESFVKVEGSEMEFIRVFYNILDNAVKYTPQGGTIKILEEVSLNRCLITIKDNGIGIEEEIIDKIFDPFFRADSARSTNGAGLGLTLVKKIIEDHKGVISIKSQTGKGTSVMISLPVTS
ncbi:MAG: HAMP domain-containing sensor histidine kinase [Candidatus Paceibacterota bacterium]